MELSATESTNAWRFAVASREPSLVMDDGTATPPIGDGLAGGLVDGLVLGLLDAVGLDDVLGLDGGLALGLIEGEGED